MNPAQDQLGVSFKFVDVMDASIKGDKISFVHEQSKLK